MRVTAPELLHLGVIDRIVPEPPGGAHRNWEQAAANLGAALKEQLGQLRGKSATVLVDERYDRFRRIGVFEEAG